MSVRARKQPWSAGAPCSDRLVVLALARRARVKAEAGVGPDDGPCSVSTTVVVVVVLRGVLFS
jgi:hypothetical protein